MFKESGLEKSMKRLRNLPVLSLTIVVLLLAGTAAKADPLSLSLTSPYQNAVAGDTVTFDATVTDIDPTEVVYLNADSITLDSPLTLDDSPFFNNFPLSLNPGDSFTGELFTVSVPLGTSAGLYSGSFEILGGDPSDFQDVVGSANFNVDVNANAVPEPSSLVMLIIGLAGFAGVLRRRLI